MSRVLVDKLVKSSRKVSDSELSAKVAAKNSPDDESSWNHSGWQPFNQHIYWGLAASKSFSYYLSKCFPSLEVKTVAKSSAYAPSLDIAS